MNDYQLHYKFRGVKIVSFALLCVDFYLLKLYPLLFPQA